MTRAYAFHLSRGWDRFIASDPDLRRLKMGLRALLGMGLSVAGLAVLGHLTHQPLGLGLVGAMVGMMTSLSVQDPLPHQQRLTLLCAPFVAAGAVCLGALSAASLVGSSLMFLGVSFLAVMARRLGPRGMALGMVAFMTFFFALFLHATVAQLPWMLASVGVGGAVAYAVRLWLVPDRSNASLRRTFAVFRRTVTLLLTDLSRVIENPEGRRWEERIRRAVRRVNEGAMEVERHLEHAAPESLAVGLQKDALREHLLALELSAGRLAAEVYRLLAEGPPSPEERQALGAQLTALWRESRGAPAPSPFPALRSRPTIARVEAALEDLRDVLARPLQPRAETARAQPTRTEQPFLAEEASAPPKLHPTTRQAIQATVACALAMVAGHALSSTRWYWAVIAAFVVFNRETTRGDILLRAWHRIFGTVVGVLAGLLVATVVHGHREIELVLVFACVFLGFYLMQVSYAWMVFWFTTLLVVLYSLLGRYSPEMLSLRIWETLVGAGIGAAVAMVLLPLRTGARVRQCSAEVLRGIASFLEAAAMSSGRADGATVVENVRKIDTKLREVREAARPLTTFLSPGERDTRRLVHALASMAFFVRQLAHVCSRPSAEADHVRRVAARLAKSARAVAASLDGHGKDAPPVPDDALQATSEAEPVSSPMLRWLKLIEDALVELQVAMGGRLRREVH